jgi:translation initiation factor IF-1
MVKNKKGGSRHKKLARKNVVNNTIRRKLRKPTEHGEMIARVTAIHGGGHAGILCTDNKVRTLVIRGKFRGRNKRDNTIRLNSIVLVGLRSVSFGEVVSKNKKEKADLIYVYNDYDMDELKQIQEVYNILHEQGKEEVNDDIIFDRTGETENIKLGSIQEKSETWNEKEDVKETLDVDDFDWDDI